MPPRGKVRFGLLMEEGLWEWSPSLVRLVFYDLDMWNYSAYIYYIIFEILGTMMLDICLVLLHFFTDNTLLLGFYLSKRLYL